jgi:hypothetical protein
MLTQLRDQYQTIRETGYQVVIIAPSSGPFLEKFTAAFGPFPFMIYGDPERQLFRSMGHHSMNKGKLLLKAGMAYLKGGSKAFMPENATQQTLVKEALKTHDIFIQGGTWVFSESGSVLWSHKDDSPEDHATIETILHVLKSY